MSFNYNQNFKHINFREHPELYEVGKGEQGVLMVEPYKSELLPHWRFKTPAVAKKSSETIYQMFLLYKAAHDFVGMDMARKFLQMGYTRARRYANHSSGRKYASNPQKEPTTEKEKQARNNILPQALDWQSNEKTQAAKIFYTKYVQAREDPEYKALRKAHIAKYG